MFVGHLFTPEQFGCFAKATDGNSASKATIVNDFIASPLMSNVKMTGPPT
jgi:hypothetical protein